MYRIGLFVLLICISTFSVASAEDLYTVSFTHVNFGPSYTNYSYIMQIDGNGAVKQQPVKVHNINWGSGPELTALAALGNNSQHLWISFAGTNTRHGTVKLSPFGVSQLSKLSIIEYSNDLQAPRNGAFLAYTREVNKASTAWAYGLTSSGTPNGNSWGLSPRTRTTNWMTGLASDGGVAIGSALASDSLQLYVQPLKSNGLPSGDPTVALYEGAGVSPDVSNVLPGNRRFLVYVFSDQGFLAPQKSWASWRTARIPIPEFHVMLQVLDAATNQRVGKPRTIATGYIDMSNYQSLAIDPAGHFLLMGAFNGSCDDLYFQALDGNGNASGSPKKIASCAAQEGGIYGIDLLKN